MRIKVDGMVGAKVEVEEKVEGKVKGKVVEIKAEVVAKEGNMVTMMERDKDGKEKVKDGMMMTATILKILMIKIEVDG